MKFAEGKGEVVGEKSVAEQKSRGEEESGEVSCAAERD